ncbi:MAG: putative ABC transporter permease [Tyzzerella sp.]|uniref:ABC transporter permease n=1 Tax=Candidatus Fimicola merdigallinarum TaxID=2840819 RepID=A0A9D9H2W0_9FIRM|nr:putative ABC transporter permease [Candidatus Fimicola merdigallinarum]
MKEKVINKIFEMFLFFYIVSVIGWIYEVFLEVVVYRWGFSNRGVLFGPYCPVYGCGALAMIICLGWLMERKIRLFKLNITPLLVFIGIVIVTTTIELISSYIMEFTVGSFMWDYTRFSFNFQGRIALNPSIRFGIGGMVILYVLYPLFKKVINYLGTRKTNIISGSLAFTMVIDFLFTFVI